MIDEYVYNILRPCRSQNVLFSNIELFRLSNLVRARRLLSDENRSRLVFMPFRQCLSVYDHIYIAFTALELLVLRRIRIDVQIVIRYILKSKIDVVRVNGCVQAHIDIGRWKGVELAINNFHIRIDLQYCIIQRCADLTDPASGLRRCAVSTIDTLRHLPAVFDGSVADNIIKAERFSGLYNIFRNLSRSLFHVECAVGDELHLLRRGFRCALEVICRGEFRNL
ncbi:hypothetical protein SDC9_136641 [bioreactor metagenome]|uniref:Uncharacterized protein n=1 Tax=bioreactor metagenome TaxID=1076179 RepID=A0A645DLU5_9ZZZZ